VSQWFDRSWSDRQARGVAAVRTDNSRFRTHVEPVLGALPIRTANARDVERLVTRLDEATRAGQSWRASWSWCPP
jgi:hypothetical protein